MSTPEEHEAQQQAFARRFNADLARRPLCRDCKHITGAFGDGRLSEYRESMKAFCLRERDLIDGHPVTCEYMRSPQGGCQQAGYLFEPKASEQSFTVTADLKPECTDPDLSPSCPRCNASNTWRWSRHYQCCSCNHRWE